MKKNVIQYIAVLVGALLLPSVMFAAEVYTAASVSTQHSSSIYTVEAKNVLKVGDQIKDPGTGKQIQIPASTTQLNTSDQNFVNALLAKYPTLKISGKNETPLTFINLSINHQLVQTYVFSNTGTQFPKNIKLLLAGDIIQDMVDAKKYRTGPFANLAAFMQTKKVVITPQDKAMIKADIPIDTYNALLLAIKNDPSEKLIFTYNFDPSPSLSA